MAFTLLDGGSGNEVVTGSVRYGEFAVHSLDSITAIASCGSTVMQCQAADKHGIIAGPCRIRDVACLRGPCAATSRGATRPR